MVPRYSRILQDPARTGRFIQLIRLLYITRYSYALIDEFRNLIEHGVLQEH